MNSLRYLIAVAALAFTVPAQAGVDDPEIIIYRVSGVADDNSVLATSFHCTNFSGVPETLRFVVRNLIGELVNNQSITVPHLHTTAVSTHEVVIYADLILPVGVLGTGTAAIAATSTNFTCTAMQVQANAAAPVGIALHMTRFNPIPGTQE